MTNAEQEQAERAKDGSIVYIGSHA